MTARPQRVLVLGCGSVAQCVVPLLVRDLGIEPSRIKVVDFVDNRARIADVLGLGVQYEQDRVTPDNLDSFLTERVGSGDLLLDLAWNIDNPTILQWCRDHNVRYLNTSVEVWDPYEDLHTTHPIDRTLYVRHMQLRRMMAGWDDNKGATAVVEHGANPGLVSHFVKQALREIATRLLSDGIAGSRTTALEAALATGSYNVLAQLSGTKVIQVSERDTQITNVPKEFDEFVNTWSVDGLYEEGVAPAEIGWGTHELRLPTNAYTHIGEGPRNQICLAQPGLNTLVRSWVPCGPINGMVIRHGESLTMSDHLTVWDEFGNPLYRPTVYYAYCPSESAIASIHELRQNDWRMQSRQRILNDEIISGRDELGVLLLGHDYTGWWTGSLLSIEQARAAVPGQSATTVQVGGSIIGAVSWMIENPSEGLRVPDELPWEEILKVAEKYLGTLHSGPTDWTPLRDRNDLFAVFGNESDGLNLNDPWQFGNFLIR